MSTFHTHRSSPARPGPPNEPPKPGPKPPPPRWLHTVWVVGLIATAALLFLPRMSTTNPTSLTYSDWLNRVDTNQVKAATIDTSGKVSGQLANGSKYTSRIPTATPNDALAGDLQAHHLAVKAVAAPSGGILAVIGGLLPFILLWAVYLWISRRATRQLACGIMGIGASKAQGL